MQKKQTAIRLSEENERLLDALAAKKGVNRTATIILAIREMAERENVTVPKVTVTAESH